MCLETVLDNAQSFNGNETHSAIVKNENDVDDLHSELCISQFGYETLCQRQTRVKRFYENRNA